MVGVRCHMKSPRNNKYKNWITEQPFKETWGHPKAERGPMRVHA